MLRIIFLAEIFFNFDVIGNSIKHLELIKKYFRQKVPVRQLPCYAGFNRLQIIQEGKVYFCVSQQDHEAAFGDLRQSSLKELWFSKEARAYRRLIRKCKFSCLQWCSYRDDFDVVRSIFQKRILFKGNKK